MKNGMKDVIVFSRIIGAALLVCGYLIAGLYTGRWCTTRGYPQWSVPLCLFLGLIAALFAGYRELKSILKMIRSGKK